jgi:SsrA-binding protein
MQIIAKHKRAFFDYEILEKYLAGISLLGLEIKSVREGHVSLPGSFISIREGEAYWKGGKITQYKFSPDKNYSEIRDRKLLLHKKELQKLQRAIDEKGLTIIPLAIGILRGRAKLEIGLAKGKKQYDKRESIKKRDLDREERGTEKRRN